MASFRRTQELIYEKPNDVAMKDLEQALNLIGKVQDVDVSQGRISGMARFGLQKVKIEAGVEALDEGSKITVHGKSDDVQGIGAEKAIDRLFETMQNLDNPDFVPSRSGVKLLPTLASVLLFVFAIIISIGMRTEQTSKAWFIIVAVLSVILFVFIIVSRMRSIN
jgi:hypothetical protein